VDRLAAVCTVSLRTFKWYHKIFYFLFDTSCNNAWFCWKLNKNGTASIYFTRRKFLRSLAEEFLERAGGPWRAHKGLGAEVELTALVTGTNMSAWGGTKRTVDQLLDTRTPLGSKRLTERHWVAKAEKRKNCVLCYHSHPCKQGERQTHHMCEQCGVHLHVEGCFKSWHCDANPQSDRVDCLLEGGKSATRVRGKLLQ
jgi:hypothetical protein